MLIRCHASVEVSSMHGSRSLRLRDQILFRGRINVDYFYATTWVCFTPTTSDVLFIQASFTAVGEFLDSQSKFPGSCIQVIEKNNMPEKNWGLLSDQDLNLHLWYRSGQFGSAATSVSGCQNEVIPVHRDWSDSREVRSASTLNDYYLRPDDVMYSLFLQPFLGLIREPTTFFVASISLIPFASNPLSPMT